MFTQNYEIKTPVLHNEKYPSMRTNFRLGDITYSFNTAALRSEGLNGMSFCFFVNWDVNYASGVIDPHIWIKKELDIWDNGVVDISAPSFSSKFLTCEPLNAVRNKTTFFNNYGFELSYTIINKTPVRRLANDENVIIELKPLENGFQTSIINYGQLKNLLVSYSGRPIRMGKPLNYYETELEKILSMDTAGYSAPFPGDCDLLLYDDNMKCKAIIEFKKRTSFGANISIANQTISNYMIHDSLKYRRLNILRSHLERHDGSTIPLLVVYYSVANDSDDNKIKIEAVSHTLQSEATDYFELPAFCDSRTSHSLILQHIMSFIY